MLRKTVLIVDDDPTVRESVRNLLSGICYQVTTAENSQEALDMVLQHDFSVVVLDITQPGKTGLTTFKEMKAAKPHLKFIVTTASAFASPEIAVEVMKLGAVDYLIKPVAPDYLERLISEMPSACTSQE